MLNKTSSILLKKLFSRHIRLFFKRKIITVQKLFEFVRKEDGESNFSKCGFKNFLSHSKTSPIIYAPFSKEIKENILTMNYIDSYMKKIGIENQRELCSVIMPVYNREKVVLQSVLSVLEQSYKNFEILLIDDGSTDNTLKVLYKLKDQRISIFENICNKGVAFSRNRGIQEAKGEKVFFLDSDNLWHKDYLAVMQATFSQLNDADALYCGQFRYNGEKNEIESMLFASFNPSLLENNNFIDLNSFGCKRDILLTLGGFNTQLTRLVDYELFLRMKEKYKIYSVPVLLSYYFFEKTKNTISLNEPIPNIKLKNPCSKRHVRQHPISAVLQINPNWTNLNKCIESILPQVDEIIVLYSQFPKNLFYKKNKKIKFIKADPNTYIWKTINQGIKNSSFGNDLLISISEAIYEKNSIFWMQQRANSSEEIGIVVPRQILLANDKRIKTHVPYARKDKDCDITLSAAYENVVNPKIFDDGTAQEVSSAPLFSLYLKNTLLPQISLINSSSQKSISDPSYFNFILNFLNKKMIYEPKSFVIITEQDS